jgi:two-component system cell cycle sensor histidine kinase/response regulator CckA
LSTQNPANSAKASATGRLRTVVVLAVFFSVLALVSPNRLATLGFASVCATLFAYAGLRFILQSRGSDRGRTAQNLAAEMIHNDTVASFITTGDGIITACNPAAVRQFNSVTDVPLARVLSETFASPQAVLYRLQSRAVVSGNASEDLITKNGHMRLMAHDIGQGGLVWRIDRVPERAPTRHSQDTQQLPMIMVGRSDAILFMNDPARRLIGARVKSLDRMFTRLPLIAGTQAEITTANGLQKTLVAEIAAGAGRRAIYLLPPPEVLQAHEQGWQAFQDLPVPMLKVAPDGAVQSFNRMAQGLIGQRLSEGIHLSELMEGLGRSITDWLNDTLAGRRVQKSEFLRISREDKEVFVQVVLNPINEAGNPALMAVMHDATELKSLEAKFVQSQKMQAIGQLAGGVAHDFNNLLTAISGHCDLLLLRHDQGDSDYSDLVQISQNANRAAALVGQLLAFSRKQTLRPETLDMRDTLADLTHLLNRLVGEKVTLTLSHDPVLHPIRADKRQLEQVLMNLVVNARDAMPEGGEIKIVTECTTLKDPLQRDEVAVPPGQYITVRVEDEGMGIAPDKLEKVFQPFFTTKRTGEGTGLGLSTAYGIVKQSGGFIFVDSIVGQGTTFILYFPVPEITKTQRVAPEKPKPVVNSAPKDGVILLVEDEAPVRAFASRALRLRGYTVLEAESAEDALKTLEDDTLNIDVFVTDVVMPGMDGPSWVREALKLRPDVRVVFVSGYAENNLSEAQDKIPNSVFLPKPFSLTELTDTVHQQLH